MNLTVSGNESTSAQSSGVLVNFGAQPFGLYCLTPITNWKLTRTKHVRSENQMAFPGVIQVSQCLPIVVYWDLWMDSTNNQVMWAVDKIININTFITVDFKSLSDSGSHVNILLVCPKTEQNKNSTRYCTEQTKFLNHDYSNGNRTLIVTYICLQLSIFEHYHLPLIIFNVSATLVLWIERCTRNSKVAGLSPTKGGHQSMHVLFSKRPTKTFRVPLVNEC